MTSFPLGRKIVQDCTQHQSSTICFARKPNSTCRFSFLEVSTNKRDICHFCEENFVETMEREEFDYTQEWQPFSTQVPSPENVSSPRLDDYSDSDLEALKMVNDEATAEAISASKRAKDGSKAKRKAKETNVGKILENRHYKIERFHISCALLQVMKTSTSWLRSTTGTSEGTLRPDTERRTSQIIGRRFVSALTIPPSETGSIVRRTSATDGKE